MLDAYMLDTLVLGPPREEEDDRWGLEGRSCVTFC